MAIVNDRDQTRHHSLTTVLRTRGERAEGDILEFADVVLSFAGVTAIDSVSFSVAPSELFAIIGPNGAGKTSIFNCLSGVYRPQQGSIRFLGRELVGLSPHHIASLGIARTFQNVELFHNLTVLDNLMFGRHQHVEYGFLSAMWYAGRAKRQEVAHRRIVEEIIDFLEIEDVRKQPVGMLPFGIQKRVELGRALAMSPEILLLDEPVAGMNLEEREDMARFVLDIKEELALTIVLVEHDMSLVMDIADRVLAVDFGRAIAVGTPEAIQGDPEVIRAYLGQQHADTSQASGSRS